MARRKITEAADLEPSEVPELDDREIAFADLLLKGMNATDAYIQAFDVHHWGRNSAQVAASRLANSDRIKLWLSYARLGAMTEGVISLEQHLRELDRLKEMALESGNVGAAVQAEQLRGKAGGLYTEKYEDVTERRDIIAWLDEQARSLSDDKDALAQLTAMAKRYGVSWSPTVH